MTVTRFNKISTSLLFISFLITSVIFPFTNAAADEIGVVDEIVKDAVSEENSDSSTGVLRFITACIYDSATDNFILGQLSRSAVLSLAAETRDIIPPFDSYPGQNWDDFHKTIFSNNCLPVITSLPTPIPLPIRPVPVPRDRLPVCELDREIIYNGSFEMEVVSSSDLWGVFPNVSGWTVTKRDDGTATLLELHRGWSGNEAADGKQYAELDPYESVVVTQAIATIPGKEYTLTWQFAPRHNIDAIHNQLEVLVNDEVVSLQGPVTGSAPLTQNEWERKIYTFTATSSLTMISFRDAGPSDTYGTFLDDVSLKCDPSSVSDPVDPIDPVDPDPVEEIGSGTSTPPQTTQSSTRRSSRANPAAVIGPVPSGQVLGVATTTFGAMEITNTPGTYPLVSGEQVSVVPQGAPNTGFGGAGQQSNTNQYLLLFLMLTSLLFWFGTRNKLSNNL